jgi:hypothetical protein
MNVAHLDPIARRVAHRFRRDVLGTSRIEYSDAGTITSQAIARLLAPIFGPLHKVTFRPGVGSVVHFEAVTSNGQPMEGRVALYAAVGDGVIVSWGEVLVDALGEISVVARHVQPANGGDTPEARLDTIARRARLALRRLSDPAHEVEDLLGTLTWIVEVAQGEAPVP